MQIRLLAAAALGVLSLNAGASAAFDYCYHKRGGPRLHTRRACSGRMAAPSRLAGSRGGVHPDPERCYWWQDAICPHLPSPSPSSAGHVDKRGAAAAAGAAAAGARRAVPAHARAAGSAGRWGLGCGERAALVQMFCSVGLAPWGAACPPSFHKPDASARSSSTEGPVGSGRGRAGQPASATDSRPSPPAPRLTLQEPSSFFHIVTGPPGGGKSTLLREAGGQRTLRCRAALTAGPRGGGGVPCRRCD